MPIVRCAAIGVIEFNTTGLHIDYPHEPVVVPFVDGNYKPREGVETTFY